MPNLDDIERHLVSLSRAEKASLLQRIVQDLGDVFPGVESTTLLMHLDLAGICCSSGSACNTGVVTASHVTNAMGVPKYAAVSAVRLSFSKYNTKEEIDRVIEVLPPLVEKLTQA